MHYDFPEIVSAVNIPPVANSQNRDALLRIVYFIDDAVRSDTQTPAFAAGQLFASGWSWIVAQCGNSPAYTLVVALGQVG